jgi:hypothetical protein
LLDVVPKGEGWVWPNGGFDELEELNTDPVLLLFVFPKADDPDAGAPNADVVVAGAPKTDVEGCCAGAPNPDGVLEADIPVPLVPNTDAEGAVPNADGGFPWEGWSTDGVEPELNADPATGAPKAEVVGPCAGFPKTDPVLPVAWAGDPKADIAGAGAPNTDVVPGVAGVAVCPKTDPPPVLLAPASPNAEGC